MVIKKALFIAALSIGMTNFAIAENDTSDTSEKKENQQTQSSKSAASTTDSNSISSQQVDGNEKKPNMVDYCRKHTC